MLLQCKLTGKAQEVCAVLSLEDSLNYDVVKTAILRAYELVPEAYRQRFRNYKKNLSQTFVEFAREKSMLFDKWCVASKVTDFQALREFILLEEFKGCISDRIAVYINEQKVSSLSNASVLADEFTLTHKTVFIARTEKVPSNSSASKDQTRFKSIGTKGREERQCFYCHKSGHVIADCFTLKRKQQINPPKNVAFVRTVDEIEKENHDEIDVGYQPFLMEGLLSADAQSTDQVKVTMLHDTGAMQTMVAEDAFSFSEQTFCGSYVLVRGIGMQTVRVPLHQIHLQSELYTGMIKVGVWEHLPVWGKIILGNDVAGGKVIPFLEVCDKPDLMISLTKCLRNSLKHFLFVPLREHKLVNLLMQMICLQPLWYLLWRTVF